MAWRERDVKKEKTAAGGEVGLVLWRANWLHWLLQGWKTPKVWVCSKLIKPRASLSHWSLKASATLLTQHQVKCSCLNAAFNFPCCETLEGAFASLNAEFNRWPNRPWTNRCNRFSLVIKKLLILMFNFTNRLSSGDVYVCSCVPTVRTALVSAAARLTGDFLFEAGNGRKYFHQLIPSCHGALKK